MGLSSQVIIITRTSCMGDYLATSMHWKSLIICIHESAIDALCVWDGSVKLQTSIDD